MNDLDLTPPPRVTSQDRLLAMVREKYPDYHPIMAMVELANACSDEEKVIELGCHKEVAKYVVAVDRFVEVKSEVKQTKRVVVELFGGPEMNRAVAHDPSPVLDVTDVVDKTAVGSTVENQTATVRTSGPVEEDRSRTSALLGVWGDGSGGAAERFS